jgi:hypothetical protein
VQEDAAVGTPRFRVYFDDRLKFQLMIAGLISQEATGEFNLPPQIFRAAADRIFSGYQPCQLVYINF